MKPQIFQIVFEDDDVLVISKESPFLSQRGDRGKHEGLDEFISRQLGRSIYAVHRLDREVLGLMVYAKTKYAANALSDQFREREVRKGYEAWVKGRVHKDVDLLKHYLKKNPKNNYVTVFTKPTEGAKLAVLRYVVLERLDDKTRLFVRLGTGRSHQIRAQLSKIGHPILGDHRYQKSAGDSYGIQLRSVVLGFAHPRTQEWMQWWQLPEGEQDIIQKKKVFDDDAQFGQES